MKLTFIYPAVGKKPGQKYIHTWKMEPLPIATLSALTPPAVEVEFFDDRLELINYDTHTNLVAITVETYTARRAYRIAQTFRARGIPVVLGGYHPTAIPKEAAEYGDAVMLGNAESVWHRVLHDAQQGKIQPYYQGTPNYAGLPDRKIFHGKTYLPLGLVETGRGCVYACEFCAITSYYGAKYHRRPIADVVADIRHSGKRYFFLVDDNIIANPQYTLDLCRAIEPLRVHWASQGTLSVGNHPELLRWLKKSGCEMLLIGFESLEKQNLEQMRKAWTVQLGNLDELVQRIHAAGIHIYATFVFGFDYDTPASFDKALEFSLKHKFYFAAFNHLLPFPGTVLYERLKREQRLLSPRWWLESDYTYGTIPFRPKTMPPEELSERCAAARRDFFSAASILRRGTALLRRKTMPLFFLSYWLQNLNLQREVDQKLDLPLGEGLDELPK